MWRKPFGSPRVNQPLQVGVFLGVELTRPGKQTFSPRPSPGLVMDSGWDSRRPHPHFTDEARGDGILPPGAVRTAWSWRVPRVCVEFRGS